MRILFAKSSRYLPHLYAGAQVNTHYLCLSLLKRGHHTAVCSLAANTKNKPVGTVWVDSDLGYPVFRSQALNIAIGAAVKKFSPDVLVLQEDLMHVKRKIYTGNLPLVIYLHSLPYDGFNDRNKTVIFPPLDRFLLIVNSDMVRDFFNSRNIKSIIVRPIFGIERLEKKKEKGNSVLCMSIQKRKGTDVVIEMAARCPDFPFIFVESWTKDNEETTALKARIKNLTNATLVSNNQDISSLFSQTRILIMPSRSKETWGRTASEAQNLGIPVLSSNRGNLPATIGNGGVTLDPDADIELWVENLRRIYLDETYYEQLSSTAQKHVAQIINDRETDMLRFESAMEQAINKHSVV